MIFPHIAVRTPILPKRDLNYRSHSAGYNPAERTAALQCRITTLALKILATVTGTRGSSKKSYFFADRGFNAVRNCEAGLFFDVTPDLDEIERSLRRKNKAHAHLGSAFQICQVSIQLIFRDSLAAVELLDAAPDLCVDCFPVLQKPTILFFLGLQQAEQDFLDAGGAGRLKLFLDSGLKGRIVDFDIHVLSLQKGIGLSFHRI